MRDKFISIDRKKYLRKIKLNKIAIFITQIGIIIAFLLIWELLANLKVIDSFITSQPSRIIKTFMNLSSNDLLHHLGVTFYETVVRIYCRYLLRYLYCYYFMVIKILIKSC